MHHQIKPKIVYFPHWDFAQRALTPGILAKNWAIPSPGFSTVYINGTEKPMPIRSFLLTKFLHFKCVLIRLVQGASQNGLTSKKFLCLLFTQRNLLTLSHSQISALYGCCWMWDVGNNLQFFNNALLLSSITRKTRLNKSCYDLFEKPNLRAKVKHHW